MKLPTQSQQHVGLSPADQKLQLYVKQAVSEAFVEAFAPEEPLNEMATRMLDAEERRAVCALVSTKIYYEVSSMQSTRESLKPNSDKWKQFMAEQEQARIQIAALELKIEAIKKVRAAYGGHAS